MTISRKREWANSSSNVVPPSNTKIDAGWDSGDQPPAPHENSQRRESDRLVNNLVDYGPDPMHHNVTHANIARRYMAESWASPANACNIMAAGSSASQYAVADTGYYNDPSTGKKYILGLTLRYTTSVPYIVVWDPKLSEADTSVGQQIVRTTTLTGSLPSPVGYWTPLAMCTDGTYAYITMQDTGATTALRVQAYVISVDGTVEWSRRSGWPPTGVAMLANTSPVLDLKLATMAMCGYTDRIAVLNSQIVVTASGTAVVTVFNGSDGSIHAAGAGGGVTGSNIRGSGALAAESSFCIYGLVNDSTFTGYEGAFAYATPSTSLGVDFPLTNPITDTLPTDIVFISNTNASGLYHVTSWSDSNVFKTAAYPNIAASTRSYFSFGWFSSYRGCTNNVTATYDTSCKIFGRMAFDGFRLWVVSLRDNATGDGEVVVNAFDPLAFIWGVGPAPETTLIGLGDLNPRVMSLSQTVSGAPASRLEGCITFDGDSMWVVTEPASGRPGSGQIYGVRRVVVRG